MDIDIPGEKGLSLLNRMPREQGKRVRVVIFSGCVTPELEKQAIEAEAIDVISKGISAVELYDRVHKILSAKHRIFKDSDDTKKDKVLVVDDEWIFWSKRKKRV